MLHHIITKNKLISYHLSHCLKYCCLIFKLITMLAGTGYCFIVIWILTSLVYMLNTTHLFICHQPLNASF